MDADNKKQYPTLAEAKSKIVPHVNILLGTISILEESPGEASPETVAAMVNKINGITTEIMATAKARKTRNENKKKEAENGSVADSNSAS